MTALVKYERPRDVEQEWIERQWMTFLTRNASARPDETGAWYVGPIDDAPPELLLDRPTPYSICRGKREAGLSLTETVIALGILLLVAAIALPILWHAFQDVRHWLALAGETVIH